MSIKYRRDRVALLVALGVSLGAATTRSALAQAPVRDLSGYTDPATAFTVQITLDAPPGTIAAGAEDTPPESWVVSNISDSGTWDSQAQSVKWGPFFAPSIPTTLSYNVAPPGTPGRRCFDGIASFDGLDQPLGGDQCVGVAVPTVSDWGIACIALAILVSATVMLRSNGRRRMIRDAGIRAS